MSDAPSVSSVPRLQHLLVRQTKATHEYDPDQALDLWRLLIPWVPHDYTGFKPAEYEGMNDEDRIVLLFELLEGSTFGDMIFGSLADDDGWCDLEKRWDDE